MVIGVFCEKQQKELTFEDCAKCAACLPAPIIRSLRKYEYKKKRNEYSVSEITGCLRKAYFERKEPPKNQFYTLKDLFLMKRGKLFEGMFSSTKWQELDGSIEYEIDGEKVKLWGRLDAYDLDNQEIIELKSTKIYENTRLPRPKNVLQLQCYGTIFKSILPVEKLRLVYFDMDIFEQHPVPFVDKSKWLQERIHILHEAIRESKPPGKEQSFECKKCLHQKNCSTQTTIPQPYYPLKRKRYDKWRP